MNNNNEVYRQNMSLSNHTSMLMRCFSKLSILYPLQDASLSIYINTYVPIHMFIVYILIYLDMDSNIRVRSHCVGSLLPLKMECTSEK